MISIREYVFESNSSSCHSLTFSSNQPIKQLNNFKLKWCGNDFGWEQREYKDPQSKFSYWLVAFMIYIDNYQHQEERKIRKTKDFWITDDKRYWDKYNGPAHLKSFTKAGNIFQQTILEVLDIFKKRGVVFEFDIEGRGTVTEDEFIQDVHKRSDEKSYSRDYTVLACDYGGYIDHQSGPCESNECKKLATMKPKKVFEWVFGDGYIVTDNDNH